MLSGILKRERNIATETILRHYRDRYHRHAVLVPSGRFGLYVVMREMLPPGSLVLISPVTCANVIRALLAAHVVPAFVDIELETGNIDVAKLPDALLNSARAIVTTNLYGNPDRATELESIARKHNLLLIEDCAHVLETSIGGRRIGSIGDVSVFSFRKYFQEPGGVVTLQNPEVASKIRAAVAAESMLLPQPVERRRYAQVLLVRGTSPAIAGPVSAIYRSLHKGKGANGKDAGPEPRSEPAHLSMPATASLMTVAGSLGRLDRFVSDRTAATRRLVARCPLPLKKSSSADHLCYFVVPFFTPRRDEIVSELERRGIQTYFRYSPPMNEMFRQELPSSNYLDSELVSYWCANVLPVDLRFSRHCVAVVRGLR